MGEPDPFRGDNPFYGPDGDEIIDRVLAGRSVATVYGLALLSVLGIVTVHHWVSRLFNLRWSRKSSRIDKIRGFLISRSPKSEVNRGMSITLLLYTAATFAALFYGACYHPVVLAFRMGIVAVVNTALLYVLGAKHSPLTLLTGWTYENLNVLHRISGALTVLATIIHTVIFLVYYRLDYIVTHSWTMAGVIAGFLYILIGFSSSKRMRATAYEIFYAIHLAGSFISIPAVFFHYPTARPFALVAGAAFAYDRAVRILLDYRLVQCTSRIAPGDTVIVQLSPKTSWPRPFTWAKGQHVFITIIGCGTFESHPFTIASSPNASETMDLIIRAREGFSKRFYDQAVQAGDGAIFKAIIHGPYGVEDIHMPGKQNTLPQHTQPPTETSPLLPVAHDYRPLQKTKVLLISGGAGVAFTYPFYQEFHNNPQFDVQFLWVVPHRSFCEWICVDDKMNVWETREQGRPNVEEMTISFAGNGPCWVAACGPDPLLRAVQNGVAKLISDGHDVHLHIEAFGW
uniref:ferric-chelate reductase (NADPH) n=1 Tax=Blastobotrys adeninivorans TaxID=409370 RepID=A0A060TID5_BLAAD